MALFVVGIGLVATGILLPSPTIENLTLDQAGGQLTWGPALFRLLLVFHGLVLLAAAFLGTATARRQAMVTPKATSAADGERPRIRPGDWWILVAMCGVALALRLWRLDYGLWLDEILTLVDFVRLPLGEILVSFPSQNQHMLYSILAHLSIEALGESAASLRLPAVLFGVGSIWATFLLGSRTNGAREALLAAGLMTVSYHHIWFSQNARGYSGLLFFATISTWFWLRATSEGRVRTWLGYVIAASLGLWIHMTMVFVLAAHGIVYLSGLWVQRSRLEGRPGPRSRWWEPLIAWILAATLTLQLYALSLPEFLRSALHEEALESSEWTDPTWVLREAARRLADIGLAGIVLIAGVVILIIGWGSIWRRDWRAAMVMALPGVLGGATMILLGHPLWPRFFFFCMSFIMLVVVRGLMLGPEILLRLVTPFSDSHRRLAQSLGVASIVLLMLTSLVTVPRAYLPKQDFVGARDFVERQRDPLDAVVAVGLAAGMYQSYYAPSWTSVETVDGLKDLEEHHPAVWLVYTLSVHLKAWYPELWRSIQEDYEVVRVFAGTLGDGDVVVCRRLGGD